MKTLTTEITINAPIGNVWDTLMDHSNYSTWNPFIVQASGNPDEGKTLSVTIHPEGKKPMSFTPIVLVNQKEREFRWLGHLFVKGLFDGEHFFKLEKIDTNTTKLIHGEKFTGVLSNVILKSIESQTVHGFNTMNEALKIKVEQSTTTAGIS